MKRVNLLNKLYALLAFLAMADVGWAASQSGIILTVGGSEGSSETTFTRLEEAVSKAATYKDVPVTINVKNGEYDLSPGTEQILNQSGWYLPVTKSNLTIKGESKEGVVVTSSTGMPNGSLASQNLITIFGDDVVLENMTLICKQETNKVIEVLGNNFTLKNIICTPPSGTNFAGSIYFNSPSEDAEKNIGNVTLENIFLSKGRITFTGAQNGVVNMKNIFIDYKEVSIEGTSMESLALYDPFGAIKGKNGLTINADNVEVLLGATSQTYYNLAATTVENLPTNTLLSLSAGTYGSENDIKSFGAISKEGIKIRAKDGSATKPKVCGTFQLMAEGCEVDGLEFFTVGGSHPVKNSIDVVAMSAVLKNNTFNMGSAATGSVGNGVCIWPYGEGKPSFTIIGNEFKGFEANTGDWSSSGLVVAEDLELSRFGAPFTVATRSKAVALDANTEKGLCKNNTFSCCYTNYSHSNWGSGSPIYLYSYLNAPAAADAIFYTKAGGTIITDDTHEDVIEEANKLSEKEDLPLGVTIKCANNIYLTSDANTAEKAVEDGITVYILAKDGDKYSATQKEATTPKVDITSLKATTIEAGQSLSSSILEGGSAKVGDKVVSGVFNWKEPATVVEKGDQTYKVIFKPNDLAKYNTVETDYAMKGIKQYCIVAPGKCANGKVEIVNANAANKYEAGTTLTLKAVADANYKFEKWSEGITDATYVVSKDTTVGAEFAPIMHTVTISANSDGSIAVNGKTDHNGSLSIHQSSEITVQAIPGEGKVLKSLTCSDGRVIGNGVVIVDKAFTIAATFTDKPQDKFIMKVSSPENGKILLYDANGNTVSAGSAVAKDSTISILAVADKGYQLKEGSLKNGATQITDGKVKISADADITAEFEKQKFALSTSVENGTIKLDGASEGNVDFGTSVSATATANAGYKLLSLLINGKEIPNGSKFTVEAKTEVKAVMSKLATIAIDETKQELIYDGEEKAFVVKTTPSGIGGFTVTYDATPIDAATYAVTIKRAADDTYAAVETTIAEGMTILAAEMKGVPMPTATDGTINTTSNLGSFAWDGNVGENPIHAAIFTPDNKNYAPSTFYIVTGKGIPTEVSYTWDTPSTRSELRSTGASLNIEVVGDGSVNLMNGSSKLSSGSLYATQRINLKAIPGANSSSVVTWEVNGITTTDNQALLELADGTNSVKATFTTKAEPTFPGMENIGTTTYDGSVFGNGTNAPSVIKGTTDWQITFKKDGIVIPSPTDAGTYQIFASCAEDANVKAVVEKNVGTFTILQKEVTAAVTGSTPILQGQTLGHSSISGTSDADGTFAWTTPEQIMSTAGEIKDQAIVFTPSSSNYTAKSELKSNVIVTETKGITLRTLSLTVNNKDNGTVVLKLNNIVVEAGATINNGDKLTVSFAAKPGYTSSATINGSGYSNGSEYTIGETGNVDVVVSFVEEINITPKPIVVTGVVLNTTEKELEVNETLQLTASIQPANANNKQVSWSSSDATIASVDTEGNVMALQAGKCNITVTTEDGGFTATCEITVKSHTGVDQITASNRVYASDGQIIIETSTSSDVMIVDMTGKIVHRNKIVGKAQVSVARGFYIVCISENGKTVTTKVIVK